ncbi:MAG: PINc/VapC family ATPase, partial [Candidatus Woesearchaeota archaeon]
AAKELSVRTVLLHESMILYLEYQANLNKAAGFLGIDEILSLRNLAKDNGFELSFSGRKLSVAELRYADRDQIDSLVRELSFDEDACLCTADKIQARLAEVKAIKVMFVRFEHAGKKIKLDSFFDDTTMSVHLRENVQPYAKKGRPGSWSFVEIRKELMTCDEVQSISREIIEEAGAGKDCFIEIERPGSTIIQLGKYRIVITKPPFSDGWEITAVKPVKRLSLDDYHLSEKLGQRIKEHAEGLLIAGAPGMGKSTFAQGLAEYYAGLGRIVKTVEAPRDLILNDNITQYAISHGDAQEIHDVLLLSRPDNTIFDEMRNTADFQLFADLRLAGIGLAGVVHATNPIDAIQRFVGRIELGVIPQVIDTVIFIKDGAVFKVLGLQMVVKVPSGMIEADLARPVVVVTDFETKKIEYELYSYGEETVVVPVRDSVKPASHQLAAKQIEQEIAKSVGRCSVEMVSDQKCILYVPKESIARIIGKQGANITELEKKLGISIDVQELKESGPDKKPVPFDKQITKTAINFFLDAKHRAKDVDILVNGDYLLSAKVGKAGVIKIAKDNRIGRLLVDAINTGEKVEILI